MKRVYLAPCIVAVFTLVAVTHGCDNRDVNSYTTFVLNEGCVHFSLEYRNYYNVDNIKPAEATGHIGQKKSSLN